MVVKTNAFTSQSRHGVSGIITLTEVTLKQATLAMQLRSTGTAVCAVFLTVDKKEPFFQYIFPVSFKMLGTSFIKRA